MLDENGRDLVETFASPPPVSEAEGADALGEELRAARLRLGWALPDVAAALRIRLPCLEALEEGNASGLPAADEALGCLRTYAAALGLDPWEMAFRFKAEEPEFAEPAPSVPAPVPRRGVRARTAALAGLMLAVSAAIGWYAVTGNGWLPWRPVPTAPERLASRSGQEESRARPSVAPAPVPAPAGPVAPPTQAANAEAAPVPPAASHPASIASEVWRLVLRAKADAWVQVRVRSGQVLLSRVLHAGEEWPVPPDPDLLLSTGNAGGTELVVDGVAAPSIGGSGAIRRDLPLDPDTIRDGKLPAQIQAASAALPPGARSASPQ